MKPFLIMKTGGTFPQYVTDNGDFEHWTAANMGLAEGQWESVDVQNGEALPDPARYAGTVITGSHDMVTEQTDWMNGAAEWIRQAVESGHPMLGICFGHQLMAAALGGEAGYHPDGMEIGTAEISLTDASAQDPLFSRYVRPFLGHVIHSQTALKLPPEATHLALNDHDAHHAFRVGDHAWGVQFHPEFDEAAIRNYIHELEPKLTEEERDVPAILATVRATPESKSLLVAFVEYCLSL